MNFLVARRITLCYRPAMRKFVCLALCLLLSSPLFGQVPATATQPPPKSASPSTAAQITTTSAPAPNTLLDGTPVKLRLSQTISSADAKVGQEVPFEVLEDVKVDGVTVLPKGSNAVATVTEAVHKKSMGRAGKLNMSITYARLSDNQKVALRATKEGKGGGHVGAMTTAMVATSLVFFPAAPLLLFIHGKDITIPQGTPITAFVDGDMHLDMSQFTKPAGSMQASAVALAPVAQSSLVVDSTPGGADISIDGAFVGNTPSTLNSTSGTHSILIQKDGFQDWTRKIAISGGTVHISANLTPTPAK